MASRRVANSLVALSSAAVLGVYTAGFLRTRSAADRFAVQAAERRPAPPAPPTTPAPVTPAEAASALALPMTSRAAATVEAPAPVAPPIRKNAVASVETATPSAVPVSEPVAPVLEAKPVAEPAPVAAPAPPPPTVPAAPAAPVYKDGTYYGWGTSRHGDIQAQVVIADGRIASATIAQCLTRYSCSWIAALPPQVAKRQSPEIDYVSGATQSTNAFYYGVVEALKLAKAQ